MTPKGSRMECTVHSVSSISIVTLPCVYDGGSSGRQTLVSTILRFVIKGVQNQYIMSISELVSSDEFVTLDNCFRLIFAYRGKKWKYEICSNCENDVFFLSISHLKQYHEQN